ncbi:MAG: histidinol dehydrogenase [Sphingomonas sp.]|nr:histidinol dehydrogenase [Sphingomonas sp.]
MKQLDWNSLSAGERLSALARPTARCDEQQAETVRAIVDDIRANGWDALAAYCQKFDGALPRRIATAPLARQAFESLSAGQRSALELMVRNIRSFHSAAVPGDVWLEQGPGIEVGKLWRPIDRVGLYVPGGRTPLFSSLLMLAIPARIAGVPEIIVTTPPDGSGGLDPMIALAASLCEIDQVWTIGGAQAIAALAFGAGDIARVGKICGPGNSYVSLAKSYAAFLPGGPAIDLPAGPSELMVIADESADPGWVAADLLGQAEHDPGAQVLLVTPSSLVAGKVVAEVHARLPDLPRGAIASASIAGARALLVEDLDQAISIANDYAPEHLSLAVEFPEELLPRVRNAGAIFCGHRAAESFGDYVNGPSHVLPTDGGARAWSGVSTYTFLRSISVHKLGDEAVQGLAPAAAELARMERLEAHARAAEARLGEAA